MLDIFENETTPYADVIFPCTCWSEQDGTFTNSERRVQRVRAAVRPPGECREPWWIFHELARRLGVDMKFESARGVWEEMRSLATGYAGISWERIEQVGIQWPAPTLQHPGTPFLHAGGNFTRGRGLFVPATVAAARRGPRRRVPAGPHHGEEALALPHGHADA